MRGDSNNRLLTIMTALISSCVLAACAGETESNVGESSESSLAASIDEQAAAAIAGVEVGGDAAGSEGEGEHDGEEEAREGGEHDEGEESGRYIARGDTWVSTRGGARLVLNFDLASAAFVGSVENTTASRLCAVRVEVHLSSGTELGPTVRTDIPIGQSIEIGLPTGGEAFDSWTAHPERSGC